MPGYASISRINKKSNHVKSGYLELYCKRVRGAMEEGISDFLWLCLGGILFCAAVWLLVMQFDRMPECAALLPEMGFEAAHVS